MIQPFFFLLPWPLTNTDHTHTALKCPLTKISQDNKTKQTKQPNTKWAVRNRASDNVCSSCRKREPSKHLRAFENFSQDMQADQECTRKTARVQGETLWHCLL